MPSPAPPGLSAACSIAFAAWNWVYWSRSPRTPIGVRLSSACSTSGGSEMFSMQNRGIGDADLGQFGGEQRRRAGCPIVAGCAARSSIGTSARPARRRAARRSAAAGSPAPPRCGTAGRCRRARAAASPGRSTCTANAPKARSRTMPNSASRIMIGFCVPHFRSVNWRVLTKYTSALNGELEAVLPALERRQDRHVLRLQRVRAGREDVGDLPLVDEDRRLRLADDRASRPS